MSDLSSLLTTQSNYVSICTQGVRAGNLYMPNLITHVSGEASTQPLVLGALLLDSTPLSYQLYATQGSYLNISTGAVQSAAVGANTVLFNLPINSIFMNCSMTSGIITCLLSGIYKVDYTMVYTQNGTNIGNLPNTAILYNGIAYGQCSYQSAETAAVYCGTAIISVVAGGTLYLNFGTTRSAGTETLSTRSISLQLISNY